MSRDIWDAANGEGDKSWAGLRRRFVEWSGQSPESATVWQQVVADPWYRNELRALAAIAARRVRLRHPAERDIKQEAMLLLARQLRRTPDLNFDPARSEKSFPGWLGQVIQNHCREVARRLRRRTRREVPLAAQPACDPRSRSVGRRDLAGAIAELAHPERYVLDGFRCGRTLREAADQVGLSYGQAKRAYHRGLRELRGRLADEPW